MSGMQNNENLQQQHNFTVKNKAPIRLFCSPIFFSDHLKVFLFLCSSGRGLFWGCVLGNVWLFGMVC
jgi:hypothetical protein